MHIHDTGSFTEITPFVTKVTKAEKNAISAVNVAEKKLHDYQDEATSKGITETDQLYIDLARRNITALGKAMSPEIRKNKTFDELIKDFKTKPDPYAVANQVAKLNRDRVNTQQSYLAKLIQITEGCAPAENQPASQEILLKTASNNAQQNHQGFQKLLLNQIPEAELNPHLKSDHFTAFGPTNNLGDSFLHQGLHQSIFKKFKGFVNLEPLGMSNIGAVNSFTILDYLCMAAIKIIEEKALKNSPNLTKLEMAGDDKEAKKAKELVLAKLKENLKEENSSLAGIIIDSLKSWQVSQKFNFLQSQQLSEDISDDEIFEVIFKNIAPLIKHPDGFNATLIELISNIQINADFHEEDLTINQACYQSALKQEEHAYSADKCRAFFNNFSADRNSFVEWFSKLENIIVAYDTENKNDWMKKLTKQFQELPLIVKSVATKRSENQQQVLRLENSKEASVEISTAKKRRKDISDDADIQPSKIARKTSETELLSAHSEQLPEEASIVNKEISMISLHELLEKKIMELSESHTGLPTFKLKFKFNSLVLLNIHGNFEINHHSGVSLASAGPNSLGVSLKLETEFNNQREFAQAKQKATLGMCTFAGSPHLPASNTRLSKDHVTLNIDIEDTSIPNSIFFDVNTSTPNEKYSATEVMSIMRNTDQLDLLNTGDKVDMKFKPSKELSKEHLSVLEQKGVTSPVEVKDLGTRIKVSGYIKQEGTWVQKDCADNPPISIAVQSR